MKTITLEKFKTFDPCWMKTEEGREKLEEIGRKKERWTALGILELEEVSTKDKLWAVLREELIEAPVLHEFACRCVEEALKLVKNPDPRSVAAIEAKRRWLRGEIGDEELEAVRAAASAAALSARSTASTATWSAWAAAWSAARAAAKAAEWAAAWAAARAAAWAAAWAAARASARRSQVEMLKTMLREEEEGNHKHIFLGGKQK